jgi:hypothetical protein
MKSKIEERLDHTVEDLRGLRDEIKLQAHLAAMDAREGWKELEKKLESAEHTLRESISKLRR